MKKLTSPFTLIKKSWDLFTEKENLLILARIYLPMGIMSLITLLPSYIPSLDNFFGGTVVATIIYILLVTVGAFVNLAGIIAVSKILKGEKPQAKNIFKMSYPKYGKFLLLTIALYLAYALGLTLLVAPFVLVITWFAFSKFIIVEKGTGIIASFTESKKIVKGYFWQVLGRTIVFGLFSLFVQMVLLFLPYGVGIIVFSLCGGLFIFPQILLYQEMSSHSKTISG